MLDAVKTHETYAIKQILRELPSKAPHLQELYIYQHAARDASRTMSIVQLHELRTLRIWCQSEAREEWFGPFMSRLAKPEHLRDLELPLGHWITDTLPTATGGFPQLRKLRLDGESRQDMLCLRPLARGMAPLRLERLEVVNTVVNSFADDYRAFEELTSACADALAIVILGLEPGRDALGRRGPMPVFNFLRPLVQLRLLQFCDISYSRSLTITDDDLRKVRGAWPLLKAFVLSWSRPYKASTVPSFRGIVDFLQEAPHLMELRLQAITMDGEVARCVKVNTLPSNLMVEDEHIHDPAAFARILRTLFPNTQQLRLHGDMASNDDYKPLTPIWQCNPPPYSLSGRPWHHYPSPSDIRAANLDNIPDDVLTYTAGERKVKARELRRSQLETLFCDIYMQDKRTWEKCAAVMEGQHSGEGHEDEQDEAVESVLWDRESRNHAGGEPSEPDLATHRLMEQFVEHLDGTVWLETASGETELSLDETQANMAYRDKLVQPVLSEFASLQQMLFDSCRNAEDLKLKPFGDSEYYAARVELIKKCWDAVEEVM
ncbi:hypothetical protein EVJ58_g6569 [Rhodofomes roseus]|uniref:Uncharacterized protein n=1 Tax=Rhodofomes roseus TaxID=34475 RepID=A0A4Y9Y6R5_9APHY|nr:hypothetical protein EVJ58_g6569 [Rhodofomes roseus]